MALARFTTRHERLMAPLHVSRFKIQVPGLAGVFGGFVIAHVSDFHVAGVDWLPIRVSEAAAAVRQAHPAVVVNSGDFLQWTPPLDTVLQVVSPFTPVGWTDEHPPAALGILGNHDYFADQRTVRDLTRGLSGLGMRMIVNQAVCWERGQESLSFVGLTDHTDDFEDGVRQLLEARRPRIAVIHEPDLIESLPHGAADFVIAGHTHGGQITVPGFARRIARRYGDTNYGDGFYWVNGMFMFVNRGLGTTGIPLRFRARPEVALLTLVR